LNDVRSPLTIAGIGALIVLVVLCAMAGAFLAAGDLVAKPAPAPQADDRGYRASEPVPTSFGSLVVSPAITLKGLTQQQLGGQTHGIGGFVARKNASAAVEVTLTNSGRTTVPFASSAFRLALHRSGQAVRRIAPDYATVREAGVVPGASMSARVSFIVPRDGSHMTLEFLDRAAAKRLGIDLQRTTGRATKAEVADAHAGHAG
jgi:hypothetical protein